MPKVRLNNVTREAALAALFNRAKPQGLGMLQYDKAHVMTENEARVVLMNGDYVDYLEGRVIKVDFKNPDEIDTTLYDRDNGKDAGEGFNRILKELLHIAQKYMSEGERNNG